MNLFTLIIIHSTNSLQENALIVIKYFVTITLKFVGKTFCQRKVFRIMFVDVNASSKYTNEISNFVAYSFS